MRIRQAMANAPDLPSCSLSPHLEQPHLLLASTTMAGILR